MPTIRLTAGFVLQTELQAVQEWREELWYHSLIENISKQISLLCGDIHTFI